MQNLHLVGWPNVLFNFSPSTSNVGLLVNTTPLIFLCWLLTCFDVFLRPRYRSCLQYYYSSWRPSRRRHCARWTAIGCRSYSISMVYYSIKGIKLFTFFWGIISSIWIILGPILQLFDRCRLVHSLRNMPYSIGYLRVMLLLILVSMMSSCTGCPSSSFGISSSSFSC
jgi:hypothetical protein